MNLEEFNRRLEENNANLIAVSDYMGRNNKILLFANKNAILQYLMPLFYYIAISIAN